MPGYLEPNLRVWLDNKSLTRYAFSATDIVQAIQKEHSEPPSGRTEHDKKEFSLRTMGEAKSVEEFESLLINSRGGAPNFNPVELGRVARVEEGTVDILQFARTNGKPAVGLGVVKQRGANAVAVARAVKAKVAALNQTLPKGTQIVVNFDGTQFVEESVKELLLTLGLAALLTSLVCWLFLGSWSSTLNVLLAIPTSILGTFIVLYFSGFTLNVFTLLGLSLAIGIVVDDAIMVLENIIRHREMGKSRVQAAREGARQITFAAMAASVALAAIFLPIAFMEGIIGRFLYQFGVTLSAAVMISLLEALTLTPMRAAQFKGSLERNTRVGRAFERGFQWVHDRYVGLLTVTLRHKWKVLIGSLVFFVLSFGTVGLLRGEFQPPQDQSMLMIQMTNPPGSAISLTDERVKVVEKYLSERKEVKSFFVAAGGFTGGETNAAIVFIELVPRGQRDLSQQEFIGVVRDFLNKTLPESKPQVQDPSTQGFGGSGSGFPIEFTIQGPDWHQLAKYADRIVEELKAKKIMTDVNSDLLMGAPEIQIVPNRVKASQRGVEVASIGEVLNVAMGGAIAGGYEKEGHRYDIRVKLQDNGRPPVERIKDLYVRNNRGELVQLSQVVDVKVATVSSTISRKNRARAIMIFGNMGEGLSQQETLTQAEQVARAVMGPDYSFHLGGSAEEMQRSFVGLLFALVLGFVVAYMVLASQFNSFIDPFTVFVALPFSFSGAFLGLLAGGQTMNLFSMIGLILLMGIVKKNSILLVDFTNQVREQERKSVFDSLMTACPNRLRPIMMTSIATIAGALPAALALGPGAEVRQPMAIAVIGGVMVSTFLTLFVVPVVYTLLDRFKSKRAE
ncbi:MAG: efflux RND transporter permease subunit [Bdellovibrionales bacterium]